MCGFKIVNSLSKKQELYRLFGFFHSAFLYLHSLVLVAMGKMWLESGIIDFYIWTLKLQWNLYNAYFNFNIILFQFFIFFLKSCLPTWSSRNPYELGFIWYVCIAGGVIPAILMITINLYVIFTLNNKVFLILSNRDISVVK